MTNQNDTNVTNKASKWESTLLTDMVVNNLEHQVGTATDTTNFSLENKINNLEYLKVAVAEIKSELVNIDQNELRDIEQFRYVISNLESTANSLETTLSQAENAYIDAYNRYRQHLDSFDPVIRNMEITNLTIYSFDIVT